MRRVVSEENRRLTILPAVLRIHALARRSRRGDDGPARAERRRGLVRRTNQGRAVWGVRVRPKTGRWAAAHRKALLGGGVVCCLGRGSLSRGVRVAASHGYATRARAGGGGERLGGCEAWQRQEATLLYAAGGIFSSRARAGREAQRAARAAGGGGRRRMVTRELCSVLSGIVGLWLPRLAASAGGVWRERARRAHAERAERACPGGRRHLSAQQSP